MGSGEQGWYPPGIAHRHHHQVPWGHPTAPPTGTSPAPWGGALGGKTRAGGDAGATPTPLLGPVAPVPFVLPAPCWCLPSSSPRAAAAPMGAQGWDPQIPAARAPPVVPGGFDAKLGVGTMEPAARPQFPHPAEVAGARVPWVPRHKALVVGGHRCRGTSRRAKPAGTRLLHLLRAPTGPQPRTSPSASSRRGFGAGAGVGSRFASCFLPCEP